MAVTIGALRAMGTRRVMLGTAHGRFEGQLAQSEITDSAVVVLFTVAGQAGPPLVVLVDSIESIEER